MTTCERCTAIDFNGAQGTRARQDVKVNGLRGAVLCDYCYGRINGSIPDPLAEE